MKKKYFGTDGIRGRVGESLINPEFVLRLGWAAGRVFADGTRQKVLIGKDTRVSGYLLESALQAGLSAAGVDVLLLGPMPTPAIAYLTGTLRCQAGIVISASHNLYEDNGIKFFGADGRKLSDDLETAIENELENKLTTVASKHLGKALRVKDAPGRYIEFCKSTIESRTRLTGMKIVLDCAHGATYFVAPNVFQELGAEVVTLGVKPDGFNINAEYGSTSPQNLQNAVLHHRADLGIALDGDGDRLIMVDDKGELVDGDELLYIIAKMRLEQQTVGGGVVGTLMSNFGLECALNELGLQFARSKVGDRYVMEELHKRGWILGGEASGHIVCLDKTTTGDGIVAAIQILHAMQSSDKSLHELKVGMHKRPQILINVKVNNANAMEHPDVQAALLETQQYLQGDGRVLLRPSGTEPVIRVMVEGSSEQEVTVLAHKLAEVVATAAGN